MYQFVGLILGKKKGQQIEIGDGGVPCSQSVRLIVCRVYVSLHLYFTKSPYWTNPKQRVAHQENQELYCTYSRLACRKHHIEIPSIPNLNTPCHIVPNCMVLNQIVQCLSNETLTYCTTQNILKLLWNIQTRTRANVPYHKWPFWVLAIPNPEIYTTQHCTIESQTVQNYYGTWEAHT